MEWRACYGKIFKDVLEFAAVQVEAAENWHVEDFTLQVGIGDDLVCGHATTAGGAGGARVQHVIEALGANTMFALENHRTLEIVIAEAAFVLLVKLAHLELDIWLCPLLKKTFNLV